MMYRNLLLTLLICMAFFYGKTAGCDALRAEGDVVNYTYRIVTVFPHDPDAFTQGLAMDHGVLYEGTGIKGRSSLRRVDLQTGEVRKLYDLPANFFGEGITVFGDRIIQLTWQSRVGLVYDKTTFRMLQFFTYSGEGWGLTHDGTSLIMSDGTDTIRFLHPETFEEQRRIAVRDAGRPVTRLNELEYVEGALYANVWETDRIAIIDPETGRVTGWVDLTGILPREPANKRYVDVLNGIAYDQQSQALYVTGKLWSKLFQIELVPIREEKSQ